MIMKLRGSLFPVALPGSVFVSPLPSGLAWTHKVLTSTWEPRSVSMPALSQQQPAGTRPGIISTWLQVVLGEVEVWTFVATLNFSWSLRQVFIRNESKPSWFHWACLQNKADAHRSLLGQTKGSPNAAQRTKGCRCSNERSGISNKLCLLETLTNMHLATASLTSGGKMQQLKRWQHFFPFPPRYCFEFSRGGTGRCDLYCPPASATVSLRDSSLALHSANWKEIVSLPKRGLWGLMDYYLLHFVRVKSYW